MKVIKQDLQGSSVYHCHLRAVHINLKAISMECCKDEKSQNLLPRL